MVAPLRRAEPPPRHGGHLGDRRRTERRDRLREHRDDRHRPCVRPARLAKQAPDPIPALLLGRLAVDRRYAGKGIGRALVAHALASAVELNASAACRAVVVSALNERARSWWESLAFHPFDPDDREHPDLYLLTREMRRRSAAVEPAGVPSLATSVGGAFGLPAAFHAHFHRCFQPCPVLTFERAQHRQRLLRAEGRPGGEDRAVALGEREGQAADRDVGQGAEGGRGDVVFVHVELALQRDAHATRLQHEHEVGERRFPGRAEGAEAAGLPAAVPLVEAAFALAGASATK